jgi:predicted nucleic acid-binding protein
VILLDTNALIWLDQHHRRAKPLSRAGRLYISPACLLELQFLHEVGRIRLPQQGVEAFAEDDRWTLDDPSAASWFLRAADLVGLAIPSIGFSSLTRNCEGGAWRRGTTSC